MGDWCVWFKIGPISNNFWYKELPMSLQSSCMQQLSRSYKTGYKLLGHLTYVEEQLFSVERFCQRTSNLREGRVAPRQKYSSDQVIGLLRKIDSDISAISLRNFTGVKNAKFGLGPVAFDWSLFRNGATYRKVKASMIDPNLFGSLNSGNQGLKNCPRGQEKLLNR